MEALTRGIAQQQNLLEVLIVVLHIVAHIEMHIKVILLVEALIQGITQTAHLSALSNPSGKTEEAYPKRHHPSRHISDHPLTNSPRLTSGARLEWLDSRLTSHQRKDIEPLKKRVLLSQKILPLKLPLRVKHEKIPLQYHPPQKTQIVSHLQNILK